MPRRRIRGSGGERWGETQGEEGRKVRHRRQRGGNTAENPDRDARGRSGVGSRRRRGLDRKRQAERKAG